MPVKKQSKFNPHLLAIIVIVAIPVIWFVGSWIKSNLDKSAARHKIETIVQSLHLDGESIYTGVDNVEGCTRDNTIVISLFGPPAYRCGYTGYKVYRSTDTVQEGVAAAESTLKSAGFEPARTYSIDKNGEIPYFNKNDSKVTASLKYFSQDANGSVNLGGSGDISLKNGNVYAVTVNTQE